MKINAAKMAPRQRNIVPRAALMDRFESSAVIPVEWLPTQVMVKFPNCAVHSGNMLPKMQESSFRDSVFGMLSVVDLAQRQYAHRRDRRSVFTTVYSTFRIVKLLTLSAP